MQPKIIYINHGIGHCIGQTIEINKALKEYPELHDKILDHELKHLKGEKYVDWNSDHPDGLVKFIIKHPSSLTHFFPIWIRNKKVIISWAGLIAFVVIMAYFVVLAKCLILLM